MGDSDRYNPHGHDEVTHRRPAEGEGTMPCCGRTPLEVPLWHRLEHDPQLVTCRGQQVSDG